jgi:hypothetical protein
MLRHLNNQEMLAITSTWSNNPDAKETFLSIPDIAPLHPKVVKVNTELLAIQPVSSEAPSELRELHAKATDADDDHDTLTRAVAAGIEADRVYCFAAKPRQLRRAEELEGAHAKLFPTGLAIVNASLLAESGNAARVGALLETEPAIAELLESIPLRNDRTVLDLAKRWIAVGKKLGKLEHQRSVLAAKQVTKPVSLATISAVRGRWLRLVSQVLSALELSDALDEAIEIIRGPVLLASERASKRYVPSTSGNPEAPRSSEDEASGNGPEELGASANI